MRRTSQRGQVMLLSTLVLSGTILASITVAGLLMLYQIRQSANAELSAKAVFAADTATEFELYKINKSINDSRVCDHAAPELTNDATYSSEITIQPDVVTISANGQAGKAFRSFRIPLYGFRLSNVPCP